MNPLGCSHLSGCFDSFSSRPVKYGAKVFLSGVVLLLSLLVLGSSAFAQATLTPTTLSFGKQGLNNTSAAKKVTLTNNESTAIAISGKTITGTNASAFAISAKTCGTSLAAHATCTISVTFTPAATGAMTATLSVADSATNSPQTVPLTGTGVAQATTSVTTLAFGNQGLKSTSAAKTVTLTNNDSTAITLSGETISGTNASAFAISAKTCGTSLAGHASCTISVTFTPAAIGAMTATLSVADSATNSPQTVPLTGTGAAQATTSVTTLAFGNQGLKSTSAAKTVTLTNNDSTAITLSGETISGTNASAFAISAKTCGTSLAGHASCTISVTFTPAAIGAMTATLSVADSATNSPQKVSLTGTGVEPVLVSIAVTPANASIAPGTTQQFTATGTYSDGSKQNLTSTATWSSSAPGVATISTTGLASAVGAGQTTIEAASGAIKGSTTLTVTAAQKHITGTLPDGATYVIDVPAKWNGTLLLYSHGYVAPGSSNPARDVHDPLTGGYMLAAGYALAGSSYATTGWAVQQAIPDQISTLDAFETAVGTPTKTIAWGHSLGGQITAGLVQEYPSRFNAALPMCGGLAGGVGIWNQALDAEFAFNTLLAGGSLQVVDITDPGTNYTNAEAFLSTAQTTKAGKARIALAAALGDTPGWYTPTSPEPSPTAYTTREANQFSWLQNVDFEFLFAYRAELEARAEGNPSFNTGVNYETQLEHSVDYAEVEALYTAAGLNLDADLETLTKAARISANPAALTYLSDNIIYNGQLTIPVLTMHTTGDGLSSVQNEKAYSTVVGEAKDSALLKETFVHRAGHCEFTPAETITAMQTLELRLTSGQWEDLTPADLNKEATALGSEFNVIEVNNKLVATPPAFLSYTPAQFLRIYDAFTK